MSDHDPQFGPLHRLDPAEPEVLPLGKLEPLDPGSDEIPTPPAAAAAPRPRDGLGLAVALAVLLSLSSIAAIGGLVAISAQSLAPEQEAVSITPVQSGTVPTIRVVEAAAEPEQAPAEPEGDSPSGPVGEAPVEPASVAVPPPPPEGSGEGEGKGDEDAGGGKGKDGSRSLYQLGGAWCDTRPGAACDVVEGGTSKPSGIADTTLQPESKVPPGQAKDKSKDK